MGDEFIICPVCHKQIIGDKCTCDYQAPLPKNPWTRLPENAIGMKPRKITKYGSKQAHQLVEMARKIALTKTSLK
jgi:hypothetical protein